MRAGRLRHVVAIQQKSETATAHHEMTDVWETLATVRAEIKPKASKEGEEADRYVARTTHEITIRPLSTVTADMRVKFGDRYFYLAGPPRDFDERGIYMTLDCVETIDA